MSRFSLDQPFKASALARGAESFADFLSTAVASISNAVMVSAIIHVVLIFGITHTTVNPRLFDSVTPPIDVVLVNAKTREKPLKPDVLAQHDLAGGGNVEENRQARSPLPVSDRDQAMSAEADRAAHAQERQAQALMQQARSSYQVPEQKAAAQAEPRPPTPIPAPADLAARSLEMARLQARIDQQMDEYQKRPRRKEYGVSAQGYSFAQYVEDWRVKVERIGNLNYPEAARRNRLYGSPILTVNIHADGNIDSIEIYRSSGHKVLDAAAIKIVEMSAPFPPFTEEMRKKADILGITRTWNFTRSDMLTSNQ